MTFESIEIIQGLRPATPLRPPRTSQRGAPDHHQAGLPSGAPQYDFTTRVGTKTGSGTPRVGLGQRWMVDPDAPGGFFGFNVWRTKRGERQRRDVFGYGLTQNYNLNVRGGTDAVRYFAFGPRATTWGSWTHNTDGRLALRGQTWSSSCRRSSRRWLGTRLHPPAPPGGPGGHKHRPPPPPPPFTTWFWSTPRNLNTPFSGASRNSPPEEWGKVPPPTRSTSPPPVWNSGTSRWIGGPTARGRPGQQRGCEHRPLPAATRGSRSLLRQFSPWGARVSPGRPGSSPRWTFLQQRPIGAGGFHLPALSVGLPVSTQTSTSFHHLHRGPVPGGCPSPRYPAVGCGTARRTFLENATMGVYIQGQIGWRNRGVLTRRRAGGRQQRLRDRLRRRHLPEASAAPG